MPKHYIIKHGKPVPVRDTIVDFIAWSMWMADPANVSERQIALDQLPDGTMVSTVFLGIDHNVSNIINPGSSPPILYETMIFVGKNTQHQQYDHELQRYATKEEALLGHQNMLGKMISVESFN